MGGPVGVGLLHNREQISGAFGVPFGEAGDLNVAVFVLHYVEKVFVVEQIQALAAVDFEVSDGHGVFLGKFEKFLNELVLKLVHGEGFAGAGLAIGKTGDNALFGEDGQQGAERVYVDICGFLGEGGGTYYSLKVLSKVKVWFYMYLVIPSTLYLGSWILIWGLAQEMESISPFCYSFLNIGRFRTQTASCFQGRGTLSWSEVVWGESILSLNLFLSIISSKSMSTSLPRSAFCFFRIYFSALAYSILILLYSLFFYIFFISSKCPPFFSPFI